MKHDAHERWASRTRRTMGPRRRGRALRAHAMALVSVLAILAVSGPRSAGAAPVDRTVARFVDPEAGDVAGAAHFVLMRELVVEAWMTAYERTATGSPGRFDDKQIRWALERHVIEELLSARLPAQAEAKLAAATESVRTLAVLAAGGEVRFRELLGRASSSPSSGSGALRTVGAGIERAKESAGRAGEERDDEHATGGGPVQGIELDAIFRRRARAELYLEIAVAQPAPVSDAELRASQARAPGPLASMPFDRAAPLLLVFMRASRLREAAQSYYQAVRSRLRLQILDL